MSDITEEELERQREQESYRLLAQRLEELGREIDES